MDDLHLESDSAPLIASGVPVGDEFEGAPIPVYYRRPPPPHPGNPGVFGTFPSGSGIHPAPSDILKEPGEDCAQLGCWFSFIPPVGFITCFLHMDAPPMSRREGWANKACIIASLVSLVIVVYFISVEESDDCDKKSFRCN